MATTDAAGCGMNLSENIIVPTTNIKNPNPFIAGRISVSLLYVSVIRHTKRPVSTVQYIIDPTKLKYSLHIIGTQYKNTMNTSSKNSGI